MQKIDRDRLDENTGQIECGEEIGTVFLIDKETAITVKHCLLIEKPETYAKNAVLHFSVKDEEKTVNATVISEDNDSSEDLVVLRCEESIDVQPLYLFRTISGNPRQFNYRDESVELCISAHGNNIIIL